MLLVRLKTQQVTRCLCRNLGWGPTRVPSGTFSPSRAPPQEYRAGEPDAITHNSPHKDLMHGYEIEKFAVHVHNGPRHWKPFTSGRPRLPCSEDVRNLLQQ